MKRAIVVVVSVLVLVSPIAAPGAAGISTSDWDAYLYSSRHTSRSPSAAISPSNVSSLTKSWTFTSPGPTMSGQPSARFYASPIVAAGRVFIGSNTGVFYALDEATGRVVWSNFVGFEKRTTCNARGVTATATVATDPITATAAAYVAGGDGYLYAFVASTGVPLWRSVIAIPSTTQNDYYDWSSPTVANGKIYVGVSSQCDTPLIQGGIRSYDQHSGAPGATWFTVPSGSIGGSVWSSVAAGTRSVWVTTGNAHDGTPGDWNSIVRLDASTLARRAAWQVPGAQAIIDGDFGGSPTLFNAGGIAMVGACNKNGFYYAWRASDLALQWRFRVAAGSPEGVRACLAAAAVSGSGLFLAGPTADINGLTSNGSIRRLDGATGTPRWETPLGGAVLGSPSLNGAGVLAVPMYDQQGGTNGVQLVNVDTGALLRRLGTNRVFAQPSFAGNFLFVAAEGGTLTAWRVP